ncbi:MAG: hypothetical protein ACAH59_06545 [Pseudobdellovibrionaceae bacterium]
MRVLIFFSSFIFALPVFAGLYGEFNGFYMTDTFVQDTTSQNSKTFYALDVYANLENKHFLFGGFHVDQVNLQENDGTTTKTLTSLNMGPMLLWVIGKSKIFSWSVGYNLVANGTYNDGTSEKTLTGTGVHSTISAMPEIAENFYLGLKLNYYSLNYNKSVVDNSSSDVTYSRTLIFPSFGMAWRY